MPNAWRPVKKRRPTQTLSSGSVAVPQLAQLETERRRDPREPKAFALWLRPENSDRRTSAWMIDMSAGGAALLTAAERAPAVGTRVHLLEMHSHDQFVRDGLAALPLFGRVLRHDDTPGLTRRIAVRFEADNDALLAGQQCAVTAAACPQATLAFRPPPPISTGLAGQIIR